MRAPAYAMLGLLCVPGAAWAQAHLLSASPAPGSTVAGSPETVSIDFTEAVEPQLCTVTVRDADDRAVTTGDPAAAPGHANRLSVGLAALAPGTYRVIWHATAVDAGRSQGTFEFTVTP